MKRSEIEQLVDTLGRDTCGVMTARSLRLGGVQGAEIAALVGTVLERKAKGIYLQKGAPFTEQTKAHIAIAHAGPGAVLTGLMAARWRKLPWVPESAEALVLVHPERRRRGTESFILVRCCAWVSQLVTTQMYAVPVAPVSQAVVDGARELDWLQDVRGLVLGAIAQKRCTVEQVRTILAKSATAGTALARRACLDAERGAASPPEAELVDALIGQGLPFYVNAEIWVDGVLVGIVDVWLVGTGTGAELDSKQWHGDAAKLDATLDRHARFERAGLSLCHATPARFRTNPAAFVAQLRAEVARRQPLGRTEPAGMVIVPRGPLLS